MLDSSHFSKNISRQAPNFRGEKIVVDME